MGLEMSLYREVDNKGLASLTDKGEKMSKIFEGAGLCPELEVIIRTEVGSWKGFNALHNYITTNFGGDYGDDYANIYLGIEDIRELYKTLKQLVDEMKVDSGLDDNELAKRLFPTNEDKPGDADYDRKYIEDIWDAVHVLRKVIDEHDELLEAGVSEGEITYYYKAWF